MATAAGPAQPGTPGAPLPQDPEAKRKWWPFGPLTTTFGTGILVGLVLLIPFAVQIHPSWLVLGSAAMFAAASIAAGSLLGLLFGVPRSVAAGHATGDADGSTLGGITANTNLEQISDWLTKILVGVSLTQLFTIKRNALHLFNAMAPSLGGGAQAAAFAGAEVVYFSVLGFFMGWLYARLRLGLLMSKTDALEYLARRADRAGDPVTAQAARQAAAASVGAVATGGTAHGPVSPVDLATSYNQLRATLAPSPQRTAQLEEVVRQARSLAKSQKFTAQDVGSMFLTGEDGSRVIALGIMQGDIRSADLDCVVDAVRNPRSTFEQWQALVVANLLVPTLTGAEREQLRQALQSPEAAQSLAAGTTGDRRRLADRILAGVAEPSG
jgi:hypothetical protein